MLTSIKNYLMVRDSFVSLNEIASHFNVEQDCMHFMLKHWIKKGCLTCHKNQCGVAGLSSKCNSCSEAVAEYYKWNPEPVVNNKISLVTL